MLVNSSPHSNKLASEVVNQKLVIFSGVAMEHPFFPTTWCFFPNVSKQTHELKHIVGEKDTSRVVDREFLSDS